MPGFWHQTNLRPRQTGHYRVECTQNCGVDYGFIPLKVTVLPLAGYQHWQHNQVGIASQANNKLSYSQLYHEGQVVYQNNCSSCHQLNGSGMLNAIPPLNQKKRPSKPLTQQINLILNGRPQHGMPAYTHRLDDEAIAAVLNYIDNTWITNTNTHAQVIRAKSVRSLRNVRHSAGTGDSIWL